MFDGWVWTCAGRFMDLGDFLHGLPLWDVDSLFHNLVVGRLSCNDLLLIDLAGLGCSNVRHGRMCTDVLWSRSPPRSWWRPAGYPPQLGSSLPPRLVLG